MVAPARRQPARGLCSTTVRLLIGVTAAVVIAAPAAVAVGPKAGSPTPGALAGFRYRYNDAYTGWPLTPVQEQHGIRGSFLDLRRPSEQGNYHIGVDISVRDDQPEPDAPPNRTHRVFAVEGGRARIPPRQAIVGCVNRIATVGHFQYWHTDTVGAIEDGDTVTPGQLIGWTCKGLWHVHLSEVQTVDGVDTWVNPLHPGGKLAPYVDTASPVIRSVRFARPGAAAWQITNAMRWSPPPSATLAASDLDGVVDVSAAIGDAQSFRGVLDEVPRLYADLHPYRVRIELTRMRDRAKLLAEDVFRGDAFLEAHLPRRGLPVDLDKHYAPGTYQNVPAIECVQGKLPTAARQTCAGLYWLRLFARRPGASWDTRRFENGVYRLDVLAWDDSGNSARKRVRVVVANP